jgi:hypothetical protein
MMAWETGLASPDSASPHRSVEGFRGHQAVEPAEDHLGDASADGQIRAMSDGPKGNASWNWDAFDPNAYLALNYRSLRDDDREIVRLVADFFSRSGVCGGRGLDVGTGANLYPALAMLPFCETIAMWERSEANVAWLVAEVRGSRFGENAVPGTRTVAGFSYVWDPYWRELCSRSVYADLGDPRTGLADRAFVCLKDVFDLPRGIWDIGTMFFVAESFSGLWREFEMGVHRFVNALRPNAPFAATFMENSDGWRVGVQEFPAVAVGAADVHKALSSVANKVELFSIQTAAPLRDGYDGMILATGYTRGEP